MKRSINNHLSQVRFFVVEEFAKLNNLEGQPSSFGSIINDNEMGEQNKSSGA